MTVFMPSIEDLVILGASILGCALLVLSFHEAYLWIREMRNAGDL